MNKLIDEKFKDCSPVDTVNRIQKLLGDAGVSATEHWFENTVSNCYALTLEMDKTHLTTNGKGVTPELAKASAYAEFMERLQSGLLSYGRRLPYQDARAVDRDTLKTLCRDFFERVSKVVSKFEKVEMTVDQLANVCFDYEGGKETTEVIPFYNATDGEMAYIPAQLLSPLYSSTGHCAGNTPEEAIVQGFSEIIERWYQRHFMCLDLVPPTVPEDYLKQFPRAYETITDIRGKGLDVIIKDCSMGSGYPVIATAVIDKKTHCYHVHLGASPIFEIALGRSLTETFQGRVVKNVADTTLSESAKNSVSRYIKSFAYGQGAYPIEFFTDDSAFPFVPFEDRTGCSNKDLLQYVMDFVKERGMKLYVRDIGHMGFPSYKLIVPDICAASLDFLTSPLNLPQLSGEIKEVRKDLKNATADQLFAINLLFMYRMRNNIIDGVPTATKLLNIPITRNYAEDQAAAYAHLGYIEWSLGNRTTAFQYAQRIAALQCPGISAFYSCFCRVEKMAKDADLESALAQLSLFYKADVIEKVKQVRTENSNPFGELVIRCHPEEGSCSDCRYAQSCLLVPQKEAAAMVGEYVKKFDNERAFSELRRVFAQLS